MVTLTQSLDRFIIWNFQHNKMAKKPTQTVGLDRKIDHFVDSLILKVNNERPFDDIAQSESERLFDLRSDIIHYLATHNKNIKDYHQTINDSIAQNLQRSYFSDLAQQVAKVLHSFDGLLRPILSQMGVENFKETTLLIENDKPTYASIRLLSLHPSARIQYIKNWMDASLALEIGLVIADLILTGQIEIKTNQMQDLNQFLKDKVIQFGAYSIFTEFGQPNPDIPYSNSMSVLAATIELENRIHQKVTLEELTYQLAQ